MLDHVTVPAGDLSDVEYVSLAWYERLWEIVKSWRALGEIPPALLPAPADEQAARRLLHLEARLLDQERLEEWLALFTADCAYWIPADTEAADPRAFISWELNDRRRLEERIERLATGKAYSQMPATRTCRLYANIECLMAGADVMHVLCNFSIDTIFTGRTTRRAGWHGFILRREGGAWRIVLKRVNLFDADLPQNNNSFTL